MLIAKFTKTIKFKTRKRPFIGSFLMVTTEGDLFDNQIKNVFKNLLVSKSDKSLLQILLNTLFLK